MTLDTLIIFAGAFVTVLPFLGFPASWDTVLLVIAGIFIIAFGIVVRRRSEPTYEGSGDTFVENLPAGEAGGPRAEHEA